MFFRNHGGVSTQCCSCLKASLVCQMGFVQKTVMSNPFKKQQIIVGVLALLVLAVAIFNRPDTGDGELHFDIKGTKAYVYGTTDSASAGAVDDLVQENPQIDTLVLKYMPGTVDADQNLRLARSVRRNRLKTHLERNSRIASGAVDLFLAGTERTMACGAQIGVHSWSIVGLETYEPRKDIFDARQRRQEGFLRDMGIDPDFYVFTRDAASPQELHILSPEEINRYNLLSTSLVC